MNEDIYISWEDFKRIFQKKKRKIVWAAILGAAISCGAYLFKPLSYQASATFKQSSSRTEQGFDIKNFIRTFSGSSEGAAAPLMLSRAVLTKAVEELGMQAVVHKQGWVAKKLRALGHNLLAEMKRLPAEHESFQFQKIQYKGEKACSLLLRFLSSNTFEVFNNRRQLLLTGQLGENIHTDDFTFTLTKIPAIKIGKFYPLTLLPLRSVVDQVKNRTIVKSLREDKNILALHFSDTDPQRAAAFVNTLMGKYEEFLIEENKSVIGAQLNYLNKRQDELSSKLDLDIKNHVAVLKQNFLEQGYMGIEQEMESILEPLQVYRSRLNEIDIEMAGLEKRLSQNSSLDLARQFEHHLTDQIQDASSLLQKLENNETPSSKGTFSALLRELQEAKNTQFYEERKQQLTTHLHTFVEHLALRQKALQESSTYMDRLETDFHGMTLDASRQLFQQYCRQLDELHAQLKQVIFFRDHIHEPHFEISTLSNVLNDSVTQHLVQKSSELEGQLCDLINRSGREHERLKETLSIQKHFLESHLGQTLELGKIRIQLIQEKISSLYNVMQDLLQKEKSVLQNKIADLKQMMQGLPELWHMDKQLKFKAELTKGMMEGLTQIAESKNLSRHLYQVESKPLDLALSPFAPNHPYLLLKTLGGALCLAALFYFFTVLRALVKGMPASLATLRLMGGHASGTFSHDFDRPFDQLPSRDLETLRGIASFLLERKSQKVALLSEKGSSFSFNLAHLLALHSQKILIVDCNFDRVVAPEDQPGLWQYLNGTAELPVRHEKDYDFLPAGLATRHGPELLSSPRFENFLSQSKEHYDFVLLLRQAPLSSQDAIQFLNLADLAVITTYEEPQESLKPFLHWSRQKEKFCATFTQYSIVTE